MRESSPSLVVAETKDGAAVRGGSETGRGLIETVMTGPRSS
jgi:hypothetical protein